MPNISPQNKDKQRENLKIDFNSLFKQSYTNKHSISKEIHLFSLDYNPSQDLKTKTIVQENEGFQFSPSISVISYRLQPITTKHNIISLVFFILFTACLQFIINNFINFADCLI